MDFDSYIEILTLKLKEYCHEIDEISDKASEVLKEIIFLLKGKDNQESRQFIKNALLSFSLISSKKDNYEQNVQSALETLKHPQSVITNHNDIEIEEKHCSTGAKKNLEDREGVEKRNSGDLAINKENSRSCEDLSSGGSLFEQCSFNGEKDFKNKISDRLDKILSRSYEVKTKCFEKIPKDRKHSDLKIGNLTDEKKIKKLERLVEELDRKGSNEQFDYVKYKEWFNETEDKINVSVRILNSITNRESEMYQNFQAIFRKSGGIFEPVNDLFNEQFNTGGNKRRPYYGHDSNLLVIMPDDIEGNQEQLAELTKYMSMSHDNSFKVQMSHGFCQTPQGEHSHSDMTFDISAKRGSRKPVKKRFTLRMHVISSEAFENAMRDCHIHSLELTYTNIFPSDIRMFIGLPIYRDGYLDGKDQQDRS